MCVCVCVCVCVGGGGGGSQNSEFLEGEVACLGVRVFLGAVNEILPHYFLIFDFKCSELDIKMQSISSI